MDQFETERRPRCAAETDAWLAEPVTSTFERLADTYRRIADHTDSLDKGARLRDHVAQLRARADAGRVEARRRHERARTLSGEATRDADR